MIEEGLCDRVQRGLVTQAGGGDDRGLVVGDREGQAGSGASAVEQDRARSALAVIAALLGGGDAEVFPQQVEQGGAIVDLGASGLSVDVHSDFGEVG